MVLIEKEISKKVLTVGPDFKNHRGGIGAVLEVYNTFFEEFKFIPTYKYYPNNFKKSIYFFCQLFLIFKRLLKDKEIEIIHIHSSHGGSFYRKFIIFIISKKFFHKKVIFHIHSGTFNIYYNSGLPFTKKLIKYTISRTDILICLSDFWEGYYKKHFRLNRIAIIKNVIQPPDNFTRTGTTDTVNFLFLGLIGKNKGIFDLLEVLKREKEVFSGKIHLFVGGNGEVLRLKNFIQTNQISDLVTFVGWVSNNGKRDLFEKTDVYILPSYNEGMPVSVLEAMSHHLPIISTRVGGIPEIVKDRVNGILVEPGNLAEIEKAIRFFIEHPEVIPLYGDQSFKIVEPYSPSEIAKQLRDIYIELLNKPL